MHRARHTTLLSRAFCASSIVLRIGAKFRDFDSRMARDATRTTLAPTRRKQGQAWEISLFRPSDLFKITKPGRYTLRLRFQIVTLPGTTGHRKPHLIRFPPLDVTLIQPAPTV